MKGFKFFGEIFFEYLFVTAMLCLSLVLVLPFIPVYIGLVKYFSMSRDYRMYKDIFRAIKENFANILLFTLLELLMFFFSVLNLYFFVTHYETKYIFIIAVSSLALFITLVLLINAPMIIVNMNVRFTGLLRNSIMLIFGGLAPALLCFFITAGIIALDVFYPVAIPFSLYFLPFINARFMKRNFNVLKAHALKVSVGELEKMERSDDYLDEYGNVNHSDETKGNTQEK